MHRSDHQQPCEYRSLGLCRLTLALAGLIQLLSSPGWAQDKVTAIQGGDIYTITGGIIRNGTLLIKDGRIWKLGTGLPIPKDAKVIKAQGQIVMPGLVAIEGSLEGGSSVDSLSPFSQSVSLALASGITSVYSGGAVIKPTYGDLDGMMVKRPDWSRLSFSRRNWRRKTEMLMSLRAAQAYLRDLAQYERDKAAGRKTTEPKRPSAASQYLPLLQREKTAFISASSASDILAALELVDEFGIKMIISGAVEGWTVAQEIAKRKVAVAIVPRRKSRANEDITPPSGSNMENAAILKRAGVHLAIIPPATNFTITTMGIAGRDLMTLPLEAAFAIGGEKPDNNRVAIRCWVAARDVEAR